MNVKTLPVICLALSLFTLAVGCSLDRGGEFTMNDTGADSSDTGIFPDQLAPDADASDWPETGSPDTADDVAPDVGFDTSSDAPVDVAPDVAEDVEPEADAPSDVVEADTPIDSPEDVVEEDSLIDSPSDAPEADAPDPVLCFGVPTEDSHVMICGSLPGGTSKSLMFKAEIESTGGGQSIPFKPVCWSDIGVAELACFPCPGPDLCWPIPGGGFPHVTVHAGDIIKFQPGIADGPGLDMKNTLCDLGKCFGGTYIVYSGHDEVCRVNPDGLREGSATYEGTGTNVKIVCAL